MVEPVDLINELLKGLQRDVRQVQQNQVELVRIIARLEQRLADVKSDLQLTIRIELGGAMANLETGLDQRFEQLLAEIRRSETPT